MPTEAMTHFILGEGRVSGGTTPGASAWQLVWSNLISDAKG
jgi:hypothetical protein